MRHRIIIAIISTLYFVSCKPLSKLESKTLTVRKLSNNNFQELNGIYSNKPDTIFGGIVHAPYDGRSDFERLTILDQLFWNVPESAYRDETGLLIDAKDKWIKIDFQSKKEATISMYKNETLVFSKSVRGKFKKGYFYIRPKFYILPFVPLVFGYNFERARIGKTEDYLIIDYSVNRWGFALVAGSSDKGTASSLHKTKMK